MNAINLRESIKKDWENAAYYQEVENDSALSYFWKDEKFLELFAALDLSRCVELACGHGRHAAHILHNYQVGSLTLIDINERNIEFCRERFRGLSNINFVVNSGNDLFGVNNDEATSLFCYDAMVHFEFDDVFAYLRELQRVLRLGGRAVLHHSNNSKQPGNLYSDNTHWRNFMSKELFHHMSHRAGLRVVRQNLLDWGESKSLDCVTLLEKSTGL
jgi:ubiquinone/menaquinone biosynthesis C-methylase UbiE